MKLFYGDSERIRKEIYLRNREFKRWMRLLLCIVIQVFGCFPCQSLYAADQRVEVGGVEVSSELLPYLGRGRSLVKDNEAGAGFRNAGDMVRITPGKIDVYGTWATNEFQVLRDGVEFLGFCAEPNAGTPAGNYVASVLDNDFIKWCLIKYQTEPQTFRLGQSFYSAAHAIIGYAYTGQTTGLNEEQIRSIQSFLQNPDMLEDLRRGVVRTSENGSLVEKKMSDYTCYIAMNTKQDIVWVQEVPRGWLRIQKVSSNPSISEKNSSYRLEGARYTIYEDEACKSEVGQLETGRDGEGRVELRKGRYYVKETEAPMGYGLEEEIYSVEIFSNQETLVGGKSISDSPQNLPLKLLLKKKDKELENNLPLGEGSLKGAEYQVSYYPMGRRKEPPLRTWLFRTDEKGEIRLTEDKEYFLSEESDALYKNEWGEYTIPLGTVVIEERKAPEGYVLSKEKIEIQIEEEKNQKVSVNEKGKKSARQVVEKTGTALEQVVRGDISFRKKDFETQKPLAGVVFEIRSKETGETHRIVTDENGYWSSSSDFVPHNQDTNGGRLGSGTWFGQSKEGRKAPVNNELGAFPYGTYEFYEIPGEQNKQKKMLYFEVKIKKDGQVVDLGTKFNQALKSQMEMHTQASSYGRKRVEANSKVEIQDTCQIKGLEVGKTYILEGRQMIRENQTPLRKDGVPVSSKTSFQATKKEMEVVVNFEVDATELSGKHLVTFERLYEEGKKEPLLVHEDFQDENQTIWITQQSEILPVKTGDEGTLGSYFGAVILSSSVLIYLIQKGRKSTR